MIAEAEVATRGPLLTRALRRRHPGLADQKMRWLLLDLAPKVLPELDPGLSRTADRVLSSRYVKVLTGTSVAEAMTDGVRLTTGEVVPARTLVWCVDVRPLTPGPVPQVGDAAVRSQSRGVRSGRRCS